MSLQGDVEVKRLQSLFPLRQSGLGFDVFPGDSLFVVMDLPSDAGRGAQPAMVVYNYIVELEARVGTPRR